MWCRQYLHGKEVCVGIIRKIYTFHLETKFYRFRFHFAKFCDRFFNEMLPFRDIPSRISDKIFKFVTVCMPHLISMDILVWSRFDSLNHKLLLPEPTLITNKYGVWCFVQAHQVSWWSDDWWRHRLPDLLFVESKNYYIPGLLLVKSKKILFFNFLPVHQASR